MQARDGESLAEQETSTQAYCNFRDIPIANIYREEGKSGKDTNRPQFQQMIRDCKRGVIDTIVVKKIDRLSRSLIDFEKTIKLFEDLNINLISIQENFDTSTAIGRAVIRIILTFAQLEREQTSERTIDVLKYRAEQGLWNGGVTPLGYDHDTELGLIANVSESKIITTIFKQYLELASYCKVAQYANQLGYRTKSFTSRRGNEKGGKEFGDTAIAGILKNPIYIGKIRYKGELYQGKHKPIISEETYYQVQELIKRNTVCKSSVKRIGTHNFILEGLLKCGICGANMAPKWSTSKGKRYFYYECTTLGHKGKQACTMKAVRAAALESLVMRRIRALKRNEPVLNGLVDKNSRELDNDIYTLEKDRIVLNIKLSEINTRSKNIVDKLLAIPELSHSTTIYDEIKILDQEKNTLSQKLKDIDIHIAHLKNRSFNADNLMGIFQYFTQIYGRLSNNDKKVLMGIIIKDITYGISYMHINYYTSIDTTLDPGLVEEEGPKPKLKVWPRPCTGSAQTRLEQTVGDRFKLMAYAGEKGKTIFDFTLPQGA